MLALLLLLTACSPTDDTDDVTEGTDAEPVALRVATFNVAMFSTQPGRIASTLERGEYEAAQILATILQDVRPDVVLLNEVDWDADGRAVGSLLDDYIGVSQDGMDPLDYPHVYVPTVNTGVASGVDLDGNGTAVTTPLSQALVDLVSGGAAARETSVSMSTFSTRRPRRLSSCCKSLRLISPSRTS